MIPLKEGGNIDIDLSMGSDAEHSHHATEMVTFGKGRWDAEAYKIAIHGASIDDRETPHIHIYYETEKNPREPMFNFAISLLDILSKDECNIIYQFDKKHNVKSSNIADCAWENYRELKKGFTDFLNQKPASKRDASFESNLELAIHHWNNETVYNYDVLGLNPLKDYLDARNIIVLEKYRNFLMLKNERGEDDIA